MDESAQATTSIDLVSLLERRWRRILGCVVAAVALGGLYFLTAERRYQSGVEILVMKKDPGATNVTGAKSSDVQADVVEDVLATHIRLFGSARVVQDAVERHGLDSLPGIASHLDDTTTAADYVMENLEVGRGGEGQAKEAQVLTASLDHTEPEEARLVLGAVVESYQEFLAETFKNVGSEAVGLIEQGREEIGADLRAAEAEYAQFRGAAPLLFAGEGAFSIHERELVELTSARVELGLKKSITESRLASVRDAVSGPNAEAYTDSERLALIDDEHVQRLLLLVNVERGDPLSESFQADQPARSEAASAEYDRLVSLRTEAWLIKQKFGDQHPKLAEIRGSIAELESFLNSRGLSEDLPTDDRLEPREVVAAYLKLLENDLVHIKRRLAESDRVIARVTVEAKKLDAVEAQDKVLADRVARLQELYDALVARVSELDMATDFGGFLTPIIKPVSVAEQVWPNPLVIGALSVVMGLCCGVGLALWTEMSDQTFHSADEVGESLHAAVLGVVPRLASTDAGDSAVDGKVVALHRARSADAEAIRSVRTALFFTAQGAERSVVQFTSPTPGDGKSLISANVAVALASAGKSVLLVDADLRKPTQHRIFGVEATIGLADLLVEEAEFPDAVLASVVENLDLLPAGTLPPNPAELLSMPRFEEFLHSRQDQYDYVIVDTPPVLVVSDPLNVASKVDGVILVTPIKPNMAGAAQHAARMLREVDATVYGAVVNDLESRFAVGGSRYGRYGSSGYGHSYGYVSDGSGYTSKAPTPADVKPAEPANASSAPMESTGVG